MNREDSRRIKLLERAGLAERTRFATRNDGQLNAKSRERLERLWSEWSGIVSDPDRRPFHVYRPRSAAKLRAAAKFMGVSASSLRGARGVPIPIPAGESPRVTVSKGTLRVKYAKGNMVSTVTWFAPGQERAALRAEAKANAQGKQVAVTIRTGKGAWSPLAPRRRRAKGHGAKWRGKRGTLQEGLAYLRAAYKSADSWVHGIEVVVL